MQASIDRFLKENGYAHSILKGREFSRSRSVFCVGMWYLSLNVFLLCMFLDSSPFFILIDQFRKLFLTFVSVPEVFVALPGRWGEESERASTFLQGESGGLSGVQDKV